MKAKLLIVLGICCLGFLTGCSSYGGCGGGWCSDYNHDSACGQYSCTDNSVIDNDPCPGYYQCGLD